jgi:predicted membrane-bound spermidine synthase
MLRNAALFAIVGTLLWTILLASQLINAIAGMARGIVAAAAVVTSLIHFVAVLSLLIFFFTYHRSQS